MPSTARKACHISGTGHPCRCVCAVGDIHRFSFQALSCWHECKIYTGNYFIKELSAIRKTLLTQKNKRVGTYHVADKSTAAIFVNRASASLLGAALLCRAAYAFGYAWRFFLTLSRAKPLGVTLFVLVDAHLCSHPNEYRPSSGAAHTAGRHH